MDFFYGRKRGQSRDGRVVKAKRKPRAGTQKRWLDSEVVSILDYMKRTIRENGLVEAPTASVYYGAMIKELQLKDINVIKLKAKVTNLKTQYAKALEWQNSADQDVLPALSEEHLMKICPHFDVLDEIYGPRVSVNPPSVCVTDVPDTEVGFEINDKVSTLVELIMNDPASSDDDSCSIEEVPAMSPQCLYSEAETLKEVKQKDFVALIAALTETQNRRTEMLTLKHKVEMQRLEYEHAFQVQNLAFKERELALTEKRHETEKQLKILEMEKNERLAKFKIEQDAKVQMRIMKFKS